MALAQFTRDLNHGSSSTDTIVSRLELFGYQPSSDEPDPRLPPDDDRLQTAAEDLFDVITTVLTGTRSDLDLDDLV